MAIETRQRRFDFVDRDLLRQCVHCGLCLPTCPTYRALGVEHDSPRGRIRQMVRLADLELTPARRPAAPPHRPVPQLSRLRDRLPLGRELRPADRGDPRRALPQDLPRVPAPQARSSTARFGSGALLDALGLAMRAYQKSGLQTAVRALGVLRPSLRWRGLEGLMPRAQGGLVREPASRGHASRRRLAATESPCSRGASRPSSSARRTRATVRVLAANGCEVVVPRGQGCCGALHVHSGEKRMAQRLARQNIAAFEASGADFYIINAAGCGSTLKEYDELLEDDPTWAERARAFVAQDARRLGVPGGRRADDASRGGSGDGRPTTTPATSPTARRSRRSPESFSRRYPGLELVPLPESDTCCGSAGVYNLTHYDLAMDILEWKVDAVASTGAEMVVASNPGCIIQIEHGLAKRGLRVEVIHPIDLLDRSLRAAELPAH